MRKMGWLRKDVYEIVQSSTFGNLILLVIFANTVIMCLETIEFLQSLLWWDGISLSLTAHFLGIYILGIGGEDLLFRTEYFKSGWNFSVKKIEPNFFIVLTSIRTIFRLFRVIRSLRALRSVRVLRTISFLRSLKLILGTVVKSLPAMKSIFLLTAILLYVFSAFATINYADVDPRRFGSILRSAYRLFQIMTTDTWTNIYRDNSNSPSVYYYSIVALLALHFIMLNLLTAVLVNNLRSSRTSIQEYRRMKKQLEAEELAFLDADKNNPSARSSLNSKEGSDNKEDLLPDNLFEEEYGLDNYYAPNFPASYKRLLSKYFCLLSAIEMNLQLQERQHKVMDDLVDLSNRKSKLKDS
ncbi:Ion transport protein-domain-containing protein [Chytridium lagenaria]|nr:Ion transport protein-domain-containing protein [Chytridium lagenaria]